jgi:hypothetical protein
VRALDVRLEMRTDYAKVVSSKDPHCALEKVTLAHCCISSGFSPAYILKGAYSP